MSNPRPFLLAAAILGMSAMPGCIPPSAAPAQETTSIARSDDITTGSSWNLEQEIQAVNYDVSGRFRKATGQANTDEYTKSILTLGSAICGQNIESLNDFYTRIAPALLDGSLCGPTLQGQRQDDLPPEFRAILACSAAYRTSKGRATDMAIDQTSTLYQSFLILLPKEEGLTEYGRQHIAALLTLASSIQEHNTHQAFKGPAAEQTSRLPSSGLAFACYNTISRTFLHHSNKALLTLGAAASVGLSNPEWSAEYITTLYDQAATGLDIRGGAYLAIGAVISGKSIEESNTIWSEAQKDNGIRSLQPIHVGACQATGISLETMKEIACQPHPSRFSEAQAILDVTEAYLLSHRIYQTTVNPTVLPR